MRSFGALGVVGGVAVVLIGAGAALLQRGGPDRDRAQTATTSWDSGGAKRSAELSDQIRATESRIQMKRSVATGLVRGEYPIERAAGRFRELLNEEPVVLARLREAHPGASDEELVLRQLMTFVRMVTPPDSGRGAAVLHDLDRRVRASAPRPTLSRVIPPAPG